MTPRQMLLSLLAHYRMVLFVFAGSLAIGLVFVEQLPVRYTAAAALLVDIHSPDPISAMLSAGNRATQEDIIKSDRVALKVVRMLELEKDAAAMDAWREATGGKGRAEVWLAGRLTRGLSVPPPRRDSTILSIEYTAADPAFAAAAANAFAQAYVETTVELRIEPSKQNARWFAEQSNVMRDNLEKSQARLSQYQQQKGIAVSDERVDLETAKLVELSTQLTTLQAQTSDVRSKRRPGSENLPEVTQNTAVQALRGEVAKQEARLKVAANNLGRSHPEFMAMESELAELRARLQAETRLVTSGFSASTVANFDKEKDLRAAIDAQKKRVLELRGGRDHLSVLQRDVDTAKGAYDSVTRRYTMTSLESQATQANVSVLTAATAPLEPTRKTDRYVLLVIAASVLLGVLAGLGLELCDRRVRTAEDVAGMLQLPVLAVIKPSHPRSLTWRRASPPALR